MKIAMLVLNDCINDSRVLKEAKTLSESNHDVRIIAISSSNASVGIEYLNDECFSIYRLQNTTIYSTYRGAIDRLFNSKKLSNCGIKVKKLTSDLIILILAPLYFIYKYFGTKFIYKTERYDELRTELQTNKYLYFTYRYLYFIYRVVKKAYRKIYFSSMRASKKIVHLIRRIIKPIKRAVKLLLVRIGVLFLVPLNKISLIYYFQKQVQGILDNWNPDVVHAHDLNTLEAAYIYCKKNSTPYVYDSHELWTHRNQPLGKNKLISYYEKYLERKLIHSSHTNITVSHNISRWIADEYNVPDPVVLRNIPHSYKVKDDAIVETNELTIKSLAGIKTSDDVILFTGRISQGRGLEVVIKSMKFLAEHINFCLLGYGNKNYIENLTQLAKEQDCLHRIHFVGAVPPDKVTKVASTADIAIIFIEPVCLSYKYCLPNKLFESIQARLPIVINDLPDMRELVEKYDVGLVTNEHDLAVNVELLLQNRDYYVANLNVAAQKLNWEKESKLLIQIYDSIESNFAN